MPPRRPMIAFVAAGLLLAAAPPAAERPMHQWEEVRKVLLAWAQGMVNADSAELAPLLHEDYPNRDRFLQNVAQPGRERINNVVLRYAEHSEIGDSVRVSPIVIVRSRGYAQGAVSLTLVSEPTGWQIVSLAVTDDFPAELVATVPEHAVLYPVPVSVSDAATDQPVVTRVHIEDADGVYWPPDGHMRNVPIGWREDVGGDVRLQGRVYAYVDPDFVVSVPAGSYEMEVVRGLEYEPATVRFDVTDSTVPKLDITLTRWSHVQEEGWYSGDTHVHFLDPRTALRELRGEDLNVVNILATKWGELITNVEHFIGAPSPLSGSDEIVYVGEETRHGFLGHTILLNLKELVYPLTWGGPDEGVRGGFDYPAMAHQADKAHAQGGLVSWAHFPGPTGELAVDIALGKIDAIDLMTWGNAFRETGRTPPAQTWYRFLNVGFDVPATAGTDKMYNSQVVGSVRTYAHVDGPFTYEAWLDGVRAGRTFVTTGPMLTLSAGGKTLGERIEAGEGDAIPVRAEVSSRWPVDKIEIVVGGRVVAHMENADSARDLVFEADISVSRSSWVAARAFSAHVLPYNGVPVMAHTSPIYVDVEGSPRRSQEDAAFLAEWTDRAIWWARTQARFQHEAQREEMIALFEQAKAIYAEQMGTSD